MLNTKLQNNRGISIYITLLIMALLLAMGLGMSAILLGQIKIIRGMGNSVIAFYAADTGVEWALYNIRKEEGNGNVSESWDTDYGYSVTTNPCDLKICIKSLGTFKETKRAIEVKY
ncbi:hypothetical protein KKB68_01665 [Patescibacteria group bacterium]|nr:hypothetical protein [Patescibacteria group bacterium]